MRAAGKESDMKPHAFYNIKALRDNCLSDVFAINLAIKVHYVRFHPIHITL